MLWIDIQYLRQYSYQLDGYKEKRIRPFLVNCRCPLCGDSVKKKSKKRGYFYEYKNSLLFRCFNCSASMSFGSFLKGFDPNLYNRYVLERYKAGSVHQEQKTDVDVMGLIHEMKSDVTVSLSSIEDLNLLHPAVSYVAKRKIPRELWHTIHYAPKFFKWASSHTDKFESYKTDHPRLVIPWRAKDGNVFSYSARAFGKEQPKYYNIVLDDAYQKIFGLDRVEGDPEYVVEGPIDSMYLPNAVAVGTSSLHIYECDGIYIPDRDIRNREILEIARRLIDNGKRVCMLPESFPFKDLGEATEHGLSQDDLVKVIKSNTYQGLEAHLKFSQWRKI